jgi:NADPH-dependent 2,4-dienoyl-CoA reductase/sulfur reductase-like enzyme
VKSLLFDAAVIGAGAAGMAASVALSKRGYTCALVDREECMGGILLQCIHNGFGLHHFGEELTGPEFSERLEREVRASNVEFFAETTVLSVERETPANGALSPPGRQSSLFSLLLSSGAGGITAVSCRSVVLAMGSRERNRGNIRIAGDRPAGVFTAGLAQRLINIDGYLPGRRVVIIGSGDIGLIMARRLTLSGAKVEAVVEIQSFPSGLTRNIVQCLNDYSIPLYLSHATLRVIGRDRVTGVEVAPLDAGAVRTGSSFILPCDTVLLSVGLVPENELSAKAGVRLNPVTNGPFVDSSLMTSVPGIFASGNVLHIHDLVDRVADEAGRSGSFCADYLDSLDKGERTKAAEIPIKAGKNIRYTVPSSLDVSKSNRIYLRSMVMMDRGVLRLLHEGKELLSRRLSWVRPGEMISVDVKDAEVSSSLLRAGGALEMTLEPEGEEAE